MGTVWPWCGTETDAPLSRSCETTELVAPDIAAESFQEWSLSLFKHQDFQEKSLERANKALNQ